MTPHTSDNASQDSRHFARAGRSTGRTPLLLGLVAMTGVAGPAAAQITYSIDYQGPTISLLDSAMGIPITEGDILTTVLPFVPGTAPAIVLSGGGLLLPLYPAALGHPAGIAGGVEVDALSYGHDWLLGLPGSKVSSSWVFSVDEFAIGLQPPPTPLPSVSTEGPVLFPAPGPGSEASADVFSYFAPSLVAPGMYPIPPFATPPGNLNVLDGDGLGPILGPGLSLLEPNFPGPGPFDMGDNLDALDIETNARATASSSPVYFSLDSGVFDFTEGLVGSASAVMNGPFVGGDVLVSPSAAGAIGLYAPATALGLDIFGPDTDDLDALVLWDNGDGVFTPPTGAFSWIAPAGLGTDMIFFSVRRGSAVIGMPDSFFGIPISEGDILMPPPAGAPLGTPPGIWVAAENLGLCTLRSGGCPGMPWGAINDDLDALDIAQDCDGDDFPDALAILIGIATDCDGNGFPDACDIARGVLLDTDGDGVPDVCECPSDTDGDGMVGITDFLNILADWGVCP